MVDVPTTDDVTDTGMSGAKVGGGVAIGELIGRSLIPGGLGTGLGGILAASMMDGNARKTGAAIAVERGTTELLAGGGSGGNTRRRM